MFEEVKTCQQRNSSVLLNLCEYLPFVFIKVDTGIGDSSED